MSKRPGELRIDKWMHGKVLTDAHYAGSGGIGSVTGMLRKFVLSAGRVT